MLAVGHRCKARRVEAEVTEVPNSMLLPASNDSKAPRGPCAVLKHSFSHAKYIGVTWQVRHEIAARRQKRHRRRAAASPELDTLNAASTSTSQAWRATATGMVGQRLAATQAALRRPEASLQLLPQISSSKQSPGVAGSSHRNCNASKMCELQPSGHSCATIGRSGYDRCARERPAAAPVQQTLTARLKRMGWLPRMAQTRALQNFSVQRTKITRITRAQGPSDVRAIPTPCAQHLLGAPQ